MLKIAVATMVKNEDDIITEWIYYHSKLFGIKNLYIIDNYSNDNTYKICKNYIKYGLNLIRKENYWNKGLYMTSCMNDLIRNHDIDIFIPLDIDEFICYFDKSNKIIKCNNLIHYYKELIKQYPDTTFFKMITINAKKCSLILIN